MSVASNNVGKGSARDGLLNEKNEPSVCNLFDIQKLAKAKLSKALYEYIASGTEDEQTLSENVGAFKNWYLRPRMMRPVPTVSTQTSLFGQPMSLPVFVSPAGVQALCDEEHGECASARACGRAGTIFGLSQHATRSIERVRTQAPNTNLWYQSYILRDRELTLRLVDRAVRAGYRGIFLTVDSVRLGFREADKRNGFDSLPPPHRLANYDEDRNNDSQKKDSSLLYDTYNGQKHESWDQNSELLFEPSVRWDDVAWLKREIVRCCSSSGRPSSLPLVVKGIMTAEDARLALDAGADGIMVSNHGGRQLDGALATIDVLPEIVRAVDGRAPVLLDSGVRRGTDVFKALALGATAVGVGKPVFFSLALNGEEGVTNMFRLLRTELENAMALCGCDAIKDIDSGFVTRHPTGVRTNPYVRSAL